MLAAFLTLVFCSISAAAYTLAPDTTDGVWLDSSGNTNLGVIKVMGTSIEDFYHRWKASPNNMAFLDTGGYLYLVYVTGSVTCSVDSNNYLVFDGINGSENMFYYAMFRWNGSDAYTVVLSEAYDEGTMQFPGILTLLGGSYTSSHQFQYPSSFEPCIPEYQGSLILVFDDGNVTKPEEPEKGLLEWIGDFFTNLWDFLIRLIVPEDGYFSDWFNEIKDAAMEKLGPIGEIVEALGNCFRDLESDISSSSLVLDIPGDHFYKGFGGVHVDLLEGGKELLVNVKGFLTTVMVILTAIICYRRLVVSFEQ